MDMELAIQHLMEAEDKATELGNLTGFTDDHYMDFCIEAKYQHMRSLGYTDEETEQIEELAYSE